MEEEFEKLIWILADDAEVFMASERVDILEDMKTRLSPDDEFLKVYPIPVFSGKTVIDKIFFTITLHRDTGEVDCYNYWWIESPYDNPFIYIDEKSFEVGLECNSLENAIHVAKEKWKSHKPSNGNWVSGEFPLT